jgi:hypothetical protein
MATKDLSTEQQAPKPPPPIVEPLTPEPGQMWLVLTLTSDINEDIVTNLMELICDDFLPTVTHLVNHVQIAANVGGTILTEDEDIVPVMETVGPPTPDPAWGA